MSSIRRFEFSEGTSNKFWEVWTQGAQLFTRYGKLGAGGQTTIKETASVDAATALEAKLVREKTGKGYLERGAAVPMPVVSTPVEAGFERYELADVFWEIKTVALRQRIRTGKIGTPGTLTEKFFDSSGDAKANTKAVIAAKVKQGFRPAKIGEQTPPTQRDPAIEAAIEKNLDDARGYLVYADWLQANSDPLGELIVLQHKKLTKQSEALLKKHAAHFWGRLAKPSERTLEPDWYCGFLSGLKLGWQMYEDEGETEQDCVDDLTALLSLPIARFLRRLELGPVTYDGVSEGMTFQAVIDVMKSFKQLPTLHELVLGDLGEWDISSTSTGAFGPLAPVLPALQRLILRAGHIDLGKNVSLPELTHLSLETGSLTKNNLKQLWSLKAPKLDSLMIWFGDPDHGASGGVKDFEPLLSRSLFPELKHLGLMNASFTDQLPDALAKSLRLPQLESLDLSLGTLTDEGLGRMLSNQAKFAHLETLNLERNALSKAMKKKSATLAKQVLFGNQDEDRVSEDGRYPAVGE